MANIPLQSISFPGLSDKYTTPTVDATLTQTGAAADAKKTGDEIAELKNDLNQFPNGTYPNMSVGNADQLTATVGIEDNVPYLFRTSGGSNDIGDREDVRKIVGVSVPWNQLVDKDKFLPSQTLNGIPYTNNGDGSITLQVTEVPSATISIAITANHSASYVHVPYNHKFIVYDRHSKPSGIEYRNSFNGHSLGWNTVKNQAQTNGYLLLGMNINTEAIVGTYTLEPQITDLTQEFGTSIADYVYTLETATAGAGVAWLNKHFPAQFDSGYQAYDAGSMQSVSGLTEHKMTGFNQFDGEYEAGYYDTSDGSAKSSTSWGRSKNTVKCLPNTTYCYKQDGAVSGSSLGYLLFYDANDNYLNVSIAIAIAAYTTGHVFTTPNGCYGIKFYNNIKLFTESRICINFHWDGEKDGTYEPYKTWSYALDDSVVIRGIPKVDANGNLYYDGDEYLPDGTVNRRYNIIDLGEQEWLTYNAQRCIYRAIISPNLKTGSDSALPNIICPKYKPVTGGATWVNGDIATTTTYPYNIFICDTNYSDAASFKAAMSGVYLLYELATPTTETALPYQATQIVDDWGTEEYVLSDGAFPVPVGHNTMYQNNLRAKLEMSPDSPDGDGLYVVQQESGENTYVPLASTATIQDILTRLTALENA